MNHVCLALLTGCLASAVAAGPPPSSCSSDGTPAPRAVLERFINADCADCWTAAGQPAEPDATLALDWIALGNSGDAGALAAAARPDANDRLQALGRALPQSALRLRHPVVASAGQPPSLLLRVAHGPPVGNYIGTSVELRDAPPGDWRIWLLLVERLPAGTEGSPVARQLVRNGIEFDWRVPARGQAGSNRFWELRPMQIPAGAQPERLAVVGLLESAGGAVAAAVQSRCGD